MPQKEPRGSIRLTNRAPHATRIAEKPDQKRVRTPVVTSTWLVAPKVVPTV
ncbi:hypothetical protein C7410_106165 [Paraburkholderia silvatlantica]|uniref:Uncharacterized protein n=1 Tax=Paraburkholderia silvatlantica TaxID=321895 RepID=A0A2V4TFM2_9BURK|nr:hypothetical protein C7410_106165 [Paraburkholderia silvatlantica]TDQ97533.1 hypothetical protein C7412_108171 [Paraburkholderia silvatlantica]